MAGRRAGPEMSHLHEHRRSLCRRRRRHSHGNELSKRIETLSRAGKEFKLGLRGVATLVGQNPRPWGDFIVLATSLSLWPRRTRSDAAEQLFESDAVIVSLTGFALAWTR